SYNNGSFHISLPLFNMKRNSCLLYFRSSISNIRLSPSISGSWSMDFKLNFSHCSQNFICCFTSFFSSSVPYFRTSSKVGKTTSSNNSPQAGQFTSTPSLYKSPCSKTSPLPVQLQF